MSTLALVPFWKKEGTVDKPYWTSADAGIKDWTKLNYTYPDFLGSPQERQERELRLNWMIDIDYGRDVLAWHDRLRHSPVIPGPPSDLVMVDTGNLVWKPRSVDSELSLKRPAEEALVAIRTKRMTTDTDHVMKANVVTSSAAAPKYEDIDHDRRLTTLRKSFIDWRIRVRAARFAFNVGYTVLLFLGKPSEDPVSWREDKNLIGMHSAFTNKAAPKCASCADQANAVDISVTNITFFLLGKYQDIDNVDKIKSYVETNLYWRIQKVSRLEIIFLDSVY
jgi:hypothetical protein